MKAVMEPEATLPNASGDPAQDEWTPIAGGTIEQFVPDPEVVERHRIRVAAPSGLTYDCARALSFQRSRIVRLIMLIRTLPARFKGESRGGNDSKGLLAEMLSIGWRVIGETPGREVVVGSVCQPWKGVVEFRSVPPRRFAAFNEPGFAKIVWTLSVDPEGPSRSLFRTETRVVTTDADSRRRFRRYWRMVVPGVVLIRLVMIRLVKRHAERRARATPPFAG